MALTASREKSPLQPARDFFEPEEVSAPLDLHPFFGGLGPLEVEIGSGNGRYLTRAAAERPDHLFLGIERSLSYIRKARERMLKYQVGNVRLVRADARDFLDSHLPPESVHDLHVYHTDPWPKRKHAKRRLIQPPFLESVQRVLRPGGRLFVQVDLFWYFEEIFGHIECFPGLEVVESRLETAAPQNHAETTAFEHKALVRKGAVFALTARKREAQ